MPCRKLVAADGEKTSPWAKKQGEPFYGKLIPIGAKVIVKPSDSKGASTSKMEPTSIAGVFAGYELVCGCRLDGINMVWPFEEFVGMDLSSKSSVPAMKPSTPHKTKVVELLLRVSAFPSGLSVIEATLRWKD